MSDRIDPEEEAAIAHGNIMRLSGVAHLLMDDEGRSFTKGEVAAAIQSDGIPPRDIQRAGNGDREAAALLLAEEAIEDLKALSLVEEIDGSWRWCGKGRRSFTFDGDRVRLLSREEREELAEDERLFGPFIGRHFRGLPNREFDPDTDDGKALLASFANGWDDNLPPILMDGDMIIDGRMRAAVCERLGIDWRTHTQQIELEELSEAELNREHVRLSLMANISIPLSTATKKDLAKRMNLEGHSTAEIAAAFGVSQRTAQRLTKEAVPDDSVSLAQPMLREVDDDTIVNWLVNLVIEDPKIGRRKAGEFLRGLGVSVGSPRLDRLLPVARSMLSGDPLMPAGGGEPARTKQTPAVRSAEAVRPAAVANELAAKLTAAREDAGEYRDGTSKWLHHRRSDGFWNVMKIIRDEISTYSEFGGAPKEAEKRAKEARELSLLFNELADLMEGRSETGTISFRR